MNMKIEYPGLVIERQRNGSLRYRVRRAGDKTKRTLLPVPPDHPDFQTFYLAARHGDPAPRETDAAPKTMRRLADRYLAHLHRAAEAGLASHATHKQRKSQLLRFCAMQDEDGDEYGTLSMLAPTSVLVRARDKWMHKPGEANNLIKSIRAMYAWAGEHEGLQVNPAAGIKKIGKEGGGATPWTADDLKAFRLRHPSGTTAFAWLTLTMFTACRIDDARTLGRRNEVEISGQLWLRWQPGKRGSAPVELPMAPPLVKALRAVKVEGATYLLTEYGKPFAPNGLGNRVRKWCAEAGLKNRSAHGVRKAVAELLAEAGCTQHQIMSVLSHTQAKTSEVYTKGAERRVMAATAMQAMAGVEW